MSNRVATQHRATRHAACGYVIHAECPVHGLPPTDAAEGPLGAIALRPGAVPEHLDAPSLVRRAVEIAPDAVLVRPHLDGETFGRLLIRGGREILVDAVPGHEREIEAFILGSGLGAICLQNGLLPLHASAVATPHGVVAFAGPSGAGKSTMAAALAARGFIHVTDDLSVLEPRPDCAPAVYPGTRTMKLAADSATALGLDTDASGIAIPRQPKRRFRSDETEAPMRAMALAAIYFLAASEGGTSITPLTGAAAAAAIGNEIYRRAWLSPMGLAEARMHDVVRIAARVPCFRLERPRRFEVLAEVAEAVERHSAAL